MSRTRISSEARKAYADYEYLCSQDGCISWPFAQWHKRWLRQQAEAQEADATLPQRYAHRRSILGPPLTVAENNERLIAIKRQYTAKMHELRIERGVIEETALRRVLRATTPEELRTAKRFHELEKIATKGLANALEAEYKTALMK